MIDFPSRLRFPRSLAALVCGLAFAANFGSAQAGDWPQFLGPARNGISTETGLVDTFPAEGPKQVWRVPGGGGMSGLVISRGKLITMIQTEGKQQLAAFNASTGVVLWKTALAPAYDNSQGPGPRATPAIAGERVFAFTGEGRLAAVNLNNGKLLWSSDITDEVHGRPADYGMASSPLVVDERVIVGVGGPQATFAAVDAATGKTAWTAGTDALGYSSAVLMQLGGRPQVVAVTGSSVLGLDPKTGTMLWRYPYVTDFNCNTASPAAVDGGVLISSGESHGSALVKLKPNGEAFDVVEAWSSLGEESVLRAEWQTPLLLDGRIYGFDNLGGAGPITHLTCLDAATGKRLWQKTRFGKGNAIAADGKLWISTLAGDLVLVRVNSTAYEELARANVDIHTRQAPILVDGRLYLRDDENIACFDVRK